MTGELPDAAERAQCSVVVLGAGYAGLRAALGLARQPGLTVTVVDRERTPAVKTRLHELHASVPTVDVETVLESTHVRFVQGDVFDVDLKDKRVRVGRSWLPYTHLIVAIGSRASDLGISGVRSHAIMLDGAAESDRLAKAVCQLGQKGGSLVVVGGGPTGVEAAAEASRRLGRGRVSVLEAGRRILPSLPMLSRLYAESVLAWLGVRVRANAQVDRVEGRRLFLRNGQAVEYDVLLWSAGVEAHPLLASAGLASPGCQADVDEFLVSSVDQDVYVVGDCAAVGHGGPSAQLAVQQGDFAAADILRRVRGEVRRPYRAEVLGQFVSLGCDAAGALQIGPIQIPIVGPLARVAKGAGEARHRVLVAARTTRARFGLAGRPTIGRMTSRRTSRVSGQAPFNRI
jgi:NADH dehydrogenase